MSALRSLLLLVLLVPRLAFADPADDAMDAGEAAFNNKDYAKARAEFQRSYDLRPDPLAIFNIAQAYRFEGNTKQAIEAYKKYVAESAAAADLRAKADVYIKQLEAAQRAAEAERQRKLADAPKDPDGTPATLGSTPRTSTRPAVEAPAATPVEPSVGRTRRIPLGSKIAAGVSGAGLVGALVFTKIGLAAEDDLKHDPNATPKDAHEVERDQNLINLAWGITGAAAITAVVIYFAAPAYSDARTIAIAPTRDGGWAAAFTARF